METRTAPGQSTEERTSRLPLRLVPRFILVIVTAVVMSVIEAPLILLVNLFTRSGLPGHWVAVSWTWMVRKAAGVRVTLFGGEKIDPNTSYIIVSNHQGMVDILAQRAVLPMRFRWVIKKELLRIPFFGWGLGATGAISLDRSRPEQASQDLQNSRDKLGNGWSIIIYPEGTRSADGHLLPFKKGGFHLAVNTGFPILPITVNGSYKVLPKGSLVIHPGHVTITVSDPIPTEGLTRDDIPELMKRTREAIESNLDLDYDPFSKNRS